MKRRIFILESTKAFLFTLVGSSALGSCNQNYNSNINSMKKKVIVVGAGISGITSARKLNDEGFDVTIFESQNKIGGRLRTNRSLGFAFDEGASWIHNPDGNPLKELALKSDANSFLTDDDSLKVYMNDGTEYLNTFLDEEYLKFEKALDVIRTSSDENISFQEKFELLYPKESKNVIWKYMLSAYLEFNTGGDISNLSSKYFDNDKNFSGKDVIITNGYDKLTNFLSEDLNITLNSRITEIDYSSIKPTIKINDIFIKADYIIVTVPLGVLKNNSIKFIPPLPENKLNAIKKTGIGNINKFLLVWNKPFWDLDVQYIGYTSEIKGKFNYFMNMNKFLPNVNALMTFAFGNYADNTENMSDDDIISDIMINLKSIYGKDIPNPKNMLRTKWRENINSFGAYSYATNGTTTDDFETMSLEVNDKIFFAGEHTEINYRGTVHGAYLSGIREANKIINLSNKK